MMETLPAIHPKMRVAIIDDDESNAISTKAEVEDAGFTPIIIGGQFKDIEQFFATIRAQAEAAVCDHRLSPGKVAQFTGAEAVARLVKGKIPSILVTSFRKRDIQNTIRVWRSGIPVMLDKDEVDPDAIKKGLSVCVAEIAGKPMLGRVPRHTIFRVASVDHVMVDVFVPAWNPDQSVPIPLNLFAPELQSAVKPGQCYFAKINIGATNSDELFFSDIKLAPEPDPEDNLG